MRNNDENLIFRFNIFTTLFYHYIVISYTSCNSKIISAVFKRMDTLYNNILFWQLIDCCSGLHRLQHFCHRFLMLWLNCRMVSCFFSFFPMQALTSSNDGTSTYDMHRIFGSNIAVTENSIDLTLLADYQHLD